MEEQKDVVLDLSLPKKGVTHLESQHTKEEDIYRHFDTNDTKMVADDVIEIKSEPCTERWQYDDYANYSENPYSKRRRLDDSTRASNYETHYDADVSHVQERAAVKEIDIDADTGAIRKTIDGVTIYLHDETLWHAFSNCGTEMIISRGGRRMFPHIVLSFEGLAKDHIYSVTLEILPADDRRYKYINNQWMGMGMADPGTGVQSIVHPDSPNTGAYWTNSGSSFSKVRLTNNKEACSDTSDGNILLLSMHKYLAVIKVNDETDPERKPLVFCFDETTFMAVTAYQNYKITQLKIKNNPFAKAFRDFQHPSSGKTTASRKKDSVKRCSPNSSREAISNRRLPTSKPDFSPGFYPFPGAATGMSPYRMNLPGLDIFNARMMNQGAMPQIPFFPWMMMSEQMNNMWMKNQQRLQDLPNFGDANAPHSSRDTPPSPRESSRIDQLPFAPLNGCRQWIPRADNSGLADYQSASD